MHSDPKIMSPWFCWKNVHFWFVWLAGAGCFGAHYLACNAHVKSPIHMYICVWDSLAFAVHTNIQYLSTRCCGLEEGYRMMTLYTTWKCDLTTGWSAIYSSLRPGCGWWKLSTICTLWKLRIGWSSTYQISWTQATFVWFFFITVYYCALLCNCLL